MEVAIRFSGQKLRAFRLASGLTQAELARRANVRERQIIRWENNQHAPRSAAVMVLGRVLGQSTDSFFTDDDNVAGDEDDEETEMAAHLFYRAVRAAFREMQGGTA